MWAESVRRENVLKICTMKGLLLCVLLVLKVSDYVLGEYILVCRTDFWHWNKLKVCWLFSFEREVGYPGTDRVPVQA